MFTREDIQESAIKLFPFPKPNPGQMDAIVEAAYTILNKTHKHTIIEAPTGIGKSIIAVTVHKVVESLIGSRFRTTIITTTKGLQDQYANSDVGLFDLRGKTNYPCAYNVGPYNSPLCRIKVRSGDCKPVAICDYVRARKEWCDKADLRLTNHSFQIEACDVLCMTEETKSNLIVIDECHEVDTNIIEHTKVDLDVGEFDVLKALNKKFFQTALADYIDLYDERSVGSAFLPTKEQRDRMKDLNSSIKEMIGEFERRLQYADNVAQKNIAIAIEHLQQIQDKTSMFANSKGSKWIVNELVPGQKIILKPVFAYDVSEFALFRKADFFLHMSATICGFETYADILGLDHEDVNVISVDNPIPLENRMVYFQPTVKVSGDIDYAKLTRKVDQIITHHKNQSGIIHTVSFQLAQEISKRSNHQKRMLVSGDYREITKHLERGGIVLSPSIEKGFDAKGDLSRFQVIAKVPFGYLGDPLTKLNSEVNKDWYARKTILRLVQACGRSVRGVDDYATTYIIDSNFSMLMNRNMDLFPEWFLDAVDIPQ